MQKEHQSPNFESHNTIETKLNGFLCQNKIPHIMFYGNYGSGKHTIVMNFLNKLYHNVEQKELTNYIMTVNCGYGRGIKFVREDIKFFSKTNISCRNGLFKTILLYNADKLTIDAQSALRRCIEQFSHSTRFIITAHDKSKILKPILSRFCSIYVPNPPVENSIQHLNLHEYSNSSIILDTIEVNPKYQHLKAILHPLFKKYINNKNDEKIELSKTKEISKIEGDEIIQVTDKLYNKGYSGLNIIKYIQECKTIDEVDKYRILTYIDNNKKEFRCERTFILCILYCSLFRSIDPFHNMLFM